MDSKLVEAGKLLEIRVGSHLYGTNHAESDEDFSGVFIPPMSYYFGLDRVEEVDLSVSSKLPNGRNASDAIDRKFYELRKFCTLALECNPNIISHLFVNEENIIFSNSVGEQLLANRQLFLHKGLKGRFIGYSISQKKKMYVKRDTYLNLEAGLEKALYLVTKAKEAKYVFEIEQDLLSSGFFEDNGNQHLICADLYIQKNVTLKKAIEQIQNRVNKFGGRKSLVDEFGYDTKFATNLIRLLLEGKELLETGDLIYPLKDRALLQDIRRGKYSLDEIEKMSVEIENSLLNEYESTDLPVHPRYDKVNRLLVEMLGRNFQ